MIINCIMTNFFVPYAGKKPAALCINGHRLLILAHDKMLLEDNLVRFGGDRLRRIVGGESVEEQEQVLDRLAHRANAGVVIAPADVSVDDLIKNLEDQLPWLQ